MEPGSDKSHLQCNKYLCVCLTYWQQHKFGHFLCFLWIRAQPQMSTALVWTVLHLAGKALTTRYPAPAGFNLSSSLRKECQVVCLPFFPSPALSPPSLSGVAPLRQALLWFLPARLNVKWMVCRSSEEQECTAAGFSELWELQGSRLHSAWIRTLLHTRTLRIAPFLLLPAASLQPPRPAGSQPQVWNPFVCVPAHKGLVGLHLATSQASLCSPAPSDLT